MAITERDTRTVPEGNYHRRAVGVFKNQKDVEHVIRKLKDEGYNMDRVSLLARNVDEVKGSEDLHETGNEAAEGAGIGATTGTILGGVTGFLIGVGVLAIPGVGPVLAAGAEISALGSTLAGAGIGAASGGIVGALIGMGIPEEKAKTYENRIKAGDYLLMVSGDENSIKHVEPIMRDRHVEEFEVFGVPSSQGTSTTVQSDRRSATTTGTVTETRDIDGDGKPEVLIVDKRKDVR